MNDLSAEPAEAGVADPDRSENAPCEVPRAATGRLAFLLIALGARLEQVTEERLATSGLDKRDYSVLAILAVDGPGTQHEIARLLGKAPAAVVAAVDQLESKGYVERQRDPADRRRSRVTPTASGRRALDRGDQVGEALISDVLSGVDKPELETLRSLLQKGIGLDAG